MEPSVYGKFEHRENGAYRTKAYLQWGSSAESLGAAVLLNPGMSAGTRYDPHSFVPASLDPTMRQLAKFQNRISGGRPINGRFWIYNLFELKETRSALAIERFEELSAQGLQPAVYTSEELTQHPWFLIGWGVEKHKPHWRHFPARKKEWHARIIQTGKPIIGVPKPGKPGEHYYYHPNPQTWAAKEAYLDKLYAVYKQIVNPGAPYRSS